jgi:hypothetical protein
MNLKSIENRLRGWIPQDPRLTGKLNFTAQKKQGNLRVFFAQSPLGMKLVVVMFWVFGALALLMAFEQATALGYLPFNVKTSVAVITVLDGAAMIVVGTGLLTMKKRWVDAAIIFSAVSIIIFYALPLRFGLPLEVIAICYLVILRSGHTLKRTSVVAPAVLAAVLCFAMVLPAYAQSPFQINTSKTPIISRTQTSQTGDFNLTVNLYQISDLDKEKDYYKLEITVQGQKTTLNFADVNASVSQGTSFLPSWKPQSSPSSRTLIGFGIASIYIGNPDTVSVYVKDNEQIAWQEHNLHAKTQGVYSVEFWVPQDADFTVSVKAEAGLNDRVFGNLWKDTGSIEGIGN